MLGLHLWFISLANYFFQWAFRYSSGGLLNVFFEPADQGTFRLMPKENLTTALTWLFGSLVFHRGADLSVLKAIPTELGGGQLGVNLALAQPNRANAVFWAAVGFFLFTVFAFAGLSCFLWWNMAFMRKSENVDKQSEILTDVVYKHLHLREMLTIHSEIMRLLDLQLEASTSLDVEVFGLMRAAAEYASNLTQSASQLAEVVGEACHATGPCSDLLTSINEAKLYFNQSFISPKHLDKTTQILRNFKVQLEPWLSLVNSLNHSSILTKLKSPKQTLTQINLATPVGAVWTRAQTQADSILRSVKHTERHIVSMINNTARHRGDMVVNAIGGVFVFVLFIAFILVVGLCRIAVKSITKGKVRSAKKTANACYSSVSCLSVFSIFIFLIVTTLVICTMFVSSALYTEGCVYLQEEGLEKSDYVLRGYLRSIWPNIGALAGMPVPGNLLRAIIQDCGMTDTGLLALIGWTNLANLYNLAQNSDINVDILHGQENLHNLLFKNDQIPSVEGILSLNNWVNELSVIETEALGLIKEFDPNKLDIDRLDQIYNLLGTSEAALPTNSSVIKAFYKLREKAPEIRNNLKKIVEVAKELGGLRDLQMLAKSFLQWLDNISMASDAIYFIS
uniref:Prominin-1-A-like n=1 Tax=Mesocestoides corti TaxID=53468 RepID=A0A5K3EHE2_MESCO